MTNPPADRSVTAGELDALLHGAQSSQDDQPWALAFSVAGTPIAQPRGRWTGGRMVATAHTDAKRWKAAIIRAAKLAAALAPQPWLGQKVAIRVDLQFCFGSQRFERIGHPHTHKPDKDNLEKMALDAIVKAELIADDAYVAIGTTSKVWAQTSGLHVLMQPAKINPIESPTALPTWLLKSPTTENNSSD